MGPQTWSSDAGGVELPDNAKWEIQGRKNIYRSDWVSLDLVAVQPPGAPAYEHHVVTVPYDAVGVVAHDPDRGVLLIHRHRFITDTIGFEVPAGGIGVNETPVEAALRETEEETGWELVAPRCFASANVSDGLTGQRFHFVYARVGRWLAEPTDPQEAAALYWVPVEELAQVIKRGEVPGSPSMLALLYALAFDLFTESEGDTS